VFKPLNVHDRWPMKGTFDAIFCRNVVIYFDKPTQARLFDRFADVLREDGFLYLGHSESLYRVSDRFRPVGQSIYRKIA
jgi:chemotaxis protein methyltransferase CheR